MRLKRTMRVKGIQAERHRAERHRAEHHRSERQRAQRRRAPPSNVNETLTEESGPTEEREPEPCHELSPKTNNCRRSTKPYVTIRASSSIKKIRSYASARHKRPRTPGHEAGSRCAVSLPARRLPFSAAGSCNTRCRLKKSQNARAKNDQSGLAP